MGTEIITLGDALVQSAQILGIYAAVILLCLIAFGSALLCLKGVNKVVGEKNVVKAEATLLGLMALCALFSSGKKK